MIDIHGCRGHRIFEKNIRTLKETSEDDKKGIYMTQLEYPAIDMDDAKLDYQKWKQLRDSLKVLAGCTDNDPYLEDGMEFIFVANPENRPLPNQYARKYGIGYNSLNLEKTVSHIFRRAGKEEILYGMEILKDCTNMPIHTYTALMLERLILTGSVTG